MTDLQKLKDLFDEIGIRYYYTQIERISCLLVNNHKCKFNFKDGKFTDVSTGDNMNTKCTKCGVFLGIGSTDHECESIAGAIESREPECSSIEQSARDLIGEMINIGMLECKMSVLKDCGSIDGPISYTITISKDI